MFNNSITLWPNTNLLFKTGKKWEKNEKSAILPTQLDTLSFLTGFFTQHK